MDFKMGNLGQFVETVWGGGKSSKGVVIETFLNFINKKSVYIKIHYVQESANYSPPPVPWNKVF